MDVQFAEADDGRWEEYDALARRAYGQPVPDIARLGPHADRRVAVRGGRVVAEGTHRELLDTHPAYRRTVTRETEMEEAL